MHSLHTYPPKSKCEHSLHFKRKIVDLFVYVSYVLPCQGENKPILMKPRESQRFIPTGWLDPAAGGDECLEFMTSWGGGGGCFYSPSAALFRAFRKPRFPNARKKGRQARLQGGAEKKAETPLWSRNELANCHRKPLSLLFQSANSKHPIPPLTAGWQKD